MLQAHSKAYNWAKHMTFAPCNTPETYNAHSSYIYQSLFRKSLQCFKLQPLLSRLHLKVDSLWGGCNTPFWIFAWSVFCLPLIFCNEENKCSVNNFYFVLPPTTQIEGGKSHSLRPSWMMFLGSLMLVECIAHCLMSYLVNYLV
jgi:hypothetical protein